MSAISAVTRTARDCSGHAFAILFFLLLFTHGSADAAGFETPPDADGDGIPDSADNCLFAANAEQRDSDADGFGNLCDGDFDNDGGTAFTDLAEMKLNFFTASAEHDMNGDGRVNASDLALLKQNFFSPPGPSGKITACVGAACENPAALCEEGTETPLLVVSWDDLPDEGSLTAIALGGQMPLTIRNAAPVTLFADIEVAGAFDELRKTISLGLTVLPPLGSVTLQLDPQSYNVDLAGLDFSGRLVARAVARLTPEGRVERMAYSPHGFLHVDETIRFYRKRPMMETFNAGDYKDVAKEPREWARARGIKLMGVGHAGRLSLDEDDGGPRGRQE